MEPLKVTLRFSAPVLRDSEYPIHLDGLIASCVMREAEQMASENAWLAADDLSGIFEKTDGEDWVWKASMLLLRPAAPRQWVNQIRRSDPDAYFDDLGVYWQGSRGKSELGINPETFKIDTGSGHQRGYQWLNATQWMDHACAWAVADEDALAHYLPMLTHVGKKGVNGYGRISGFTIEKASGDEVDNWMLRTLPAGMPGKADIQYEPVNACLRAPYWRKIDRITAQEPIV